MVIHVSSSYCRSTSVIFYALISTSSMKNTINRTCWSFSIRVERLTVFIRDVIHIIKMCIHSFIKCGPGISSVTDMQMELASKNRIVKRRLSDNWASVNWDSVFSRSRFHWAWSVISSWVHILRLSLDRGEQKCLSGAEQPNRQNLDVFWLG